MESNSTPIQDFDFLFPGESGGQVIWLVFLSVIMIFGVIGNSLILRVYSTKTLTTCTHVLIMALALTDISVCIFLSLDICSLILLLMNSTVPRVLYVSRYIRTSMISACITNTVLIALDRYDCVCRSNRRILTPRRGKIAAWFALVVSFLATIPDLIDRLRNQSQNQMILLTSQGLAFVFSLVVIAFCYRQVFNKIRKHVKVFAMTSAGDPATELSTRVQPSTSPNKHLAVSIIGKYVSDRSRDDCSNQEGCSYQDTAMDNRPQQSSVNLNVSVTTESATHDNVPGNKLILKPSDQPAVKNTNKARVVDNRRPKKAENNGATLQRKTTIMLFITSLVYLLTWLPYWFFIVLFIIDSKGSSVDRKLMDTSQAFLVILYANNALNPLIYGIANRRFREDCLKVFCKDKVAN
ncbi:alpha-2Db adrenergic receptor-like [Asterias amurensis]|uniref:alpha-2Db adrenergic receptor-like n=1 Tax=Asterias amurensis TaxID=7602 RepID=UPI003AB3DE6E